MYTTTNCYLMFRNSTLLRQPNYALVIKERDVRCGGSATGDCFLALHKTHIRFLDFSRGWQALATPNVQFSVTKYAIGKSREAIMDELQEYAILPVQWKLSIGDWDNIESVYEWDGKCIIPLWHKLLKVGNISWNLRMSYVDPAIT